MTTTPPTTLQSCRQMLAQVDAAEDLSALAAAYVSIVGYDPFEDDAQADPHEVHQTLRDFVREVAVSFCVPWAAVDPLAGAPELPALSPAV
jgi:hypothetical protein